MKQKTMFIVPYRRTGHKQLVLCFKTFQSHNLTLLNKLLFIHIYKRVRCVKYICHFCLLIPRNQFVKFNLIFYRYQNKN